MTEPARPQSTPLTFDAALELIVQARLLTREQVHEMKLHAERKRRLLERERKQQTGEDAAVISPAELIAAFQMPTTDGQVLGEERVQRTIAAAYNMRFTRIDPLKLDAKLVSTLVSQAYARRNCLLPMGRDGATLVLAVDDPICAEVRATMASRPDQPVELVLALRSEIQRQIADIFQFRANIRGAQVDLGVSETDLGNLEQLVKLTAAGQQVADDDRHVVRAVDFLLKYALDQKASDIHIEPKREVSHVRLRIDGVLHTVNQLPKVVHAAVTSRIKAMARLDIAEKRRPQDGRIKISRDSGEVKVGAAEKPGIEVEMRISVMPTAFGEKIVMRIFDPQTVFQDMGQLGLFPKQLEIVETFIKRPHGLILVCGPTGSGKTTTLYSALRALATPTLNITTIEDPIEMVVEAFNQTAVNPRVGLTFGAALRTLLRQDPDVIMVGEIRDTETAQNAIQAAMTGHLVLSTVHTNDAPSTIARLLDLEVPPYLISSTLVGVISQRLLRTICLSCRKETELAPAEAQLLGIEQRPGERFRVFVGAGCNICRDTGLKGRMGVYEVMPVTDKIRRLVLTKAPAAEIARQAVQDGMVTLRESAIRKMALGLTSFSEVLRATTDGDF